jgi:hypothetical protein
LEGNFRMLHDRIGMSHIAVFHRFLSVRHGFGHM